MALPLHPSPKEFRQYIIYISLYKRQIKTPGSFITVTTQGRCILQRKSLPAHPIRDQQIKTPPAGGVFIFSSVLATQLFNWRTTIFLQVYKTDFDHTSRGRYLQIKNHRKRSCYNCIVCYIFLNIAACHSG